MNAKKAVNTETAWLRRVETKVRGFCADYSVTFAVGSRERAASFEIGCLHMLVKNYEDALFGSVSVQNLNKDNEFRYLTSPSGNPENFSWFKFTIKDEAFEIRQQVRIKSHWHADVAFCPDIVVLRPNTKIEDPKYPEYAGGKRRFFHVLSNQVVSAHECKSLPPFPELLVSFIGMFGAAHEWYNPRLDTDYLSEDGIHPAPCLYVGGDTMGMQQRMAKGLETTFPVNIVSGLHFGKFRMSRKADNNDYTIRYLADSLIEENLTK